MSSASRITFTVPTPQMIFLRREAERLGIPVAELLRRIIDAHREAKAAA